MRQSSFVLVLAVLAVCLFAGASAGEEREVIFSDDFSSYTDEASLSQKWSNFSGHWFVKDGILNQDAGGYDCGAVVRDLYLRCDYRIETKVRLVGGGAGAGLYWNVFDQLTGESGNMLRYDGNLPIMYGWMHGRGFLGTGGATGNLMPDGTWHAMRMDVNNTAGTFDVYWDSKKIVDGAAEYHRSGYAGLECSMGYSQFDDVQISVARGTDWRASPRGKVAPEWVESVALLADGNIVYPVRNMHRIQIVTPDGTLVREFGELGSGPGQLNLPAAVATDKDDDIYVVEMGNNRVQVFDSTGKSLRVLAPAGTSALKRPYGIALEPGGRVWVSDSGNSRILCLNADGTVAASVGAPAAGSKPGEFNGPRHLAFISGKLYVADTNNGRIQTLDPENPSAAPRVVPTPGMQPRAVTSGPKGSFVVSNGSGLALFDADWKQTKLYRGEFASTVFAEQAVYDKSGNLVVADAWNKRIVTLSPRLSEVTPEVSSLAADSAVVSWKTDLPTATKILIVATPQGSTIPSSIQYSKGQETGDGKLTTDHKVALSGLTPAARYAYAIVSPLKTIPPAGNSLDYRFTTEAPPGLMAYSEVPIAILCYANVTYESQKSPDGKVTPPTIRDDNWFQQNIKIHEAMRMFYLANSSFRLDVACKYLKVDRPVDVAYLGSSSEELARDLETLAQKEGLKPTDFGAVLCMGGNCCYAYPWPTPWWGGKLTYTTGACFPGGGDLWLSTHEFHHLTEGWMGASGERRYNSADMPWVHPGRFGENYDFLAHVNRYIPATSYLNLAFGNLKVTADRDGDGVPDFCPSLIWDEKRAGTDPNDKYSYKNGLTDLQNLTAETMHPAKRGLKHPMLTKEIDLRHPFAVFDYQYERPKKTQTIDGNFKASEWDLFVQTPNAITPGPADSIYSTVYVPPAGADYRMKIYQNWDNDCLYFAATAPYKFAISFQLDGNGDGYFHGHDNVIMAVQIPRDESTAKPYTILPPPGVMVWNCLEPVKESNMPNWTNDLYDAKDRIKWAWGKGDDGWYNVEIAIPKCEKCDFVPRAGKEMGVRFWIRGLLPPTDKDPDPGWVFEQFDSCEYGYFKLVK
jgi:DNA-binding beta-propeller fold protein YncE